jgi:thymidylate kinase
MKMSKNTRIAVVGPCAAGKSTLVRELVRRGYQAKHIAQEHSYAPAMWQKISNPDILIYLDVSYPISMARRPLNWTEEEFCAQNDRLQHARQHADLYLHTDPLSIEQVLTAVLDYLSA